MKPPPPPPQHDPQSYTDIKDTLPRLIQDAINNKTSLPPTYVQPPSTFGTALLPREIENELRLYRKDCGSTTTIESVLQHLNRVFSSLPEPISGEEMTKALFITAPTDCLLSVQTHRDRGASIVEIYSTLQDAHGTRRTRDELDAEIQILLKNDANKTPVAVLEGLETLILRSPDSKEDPNVLAIREAKRYLKLLGGETLMNSVQACLPPPWFIYI